jgi:phosphoenolpyruvate-protein phosphotransferase
MRAIRGVAASPGVARGRWTHVERAALPAAGHIESGAADREVGRLAAASKAAAAELHGIADEVSRGGHPDEAEIFAAQAAIAGDPALATMAGERIAAGDDAIGGISGAASAFAQQLRSIGDELIAARAADVLDVGDRIARHLAGVPTGSATALDQPAIVVAVDLPPSVTATLPRDRMLGLALEGSSPTAHASILARAYGIPAVVGATGLIAALGSSPAGGELAIDGDTGEVVIDPDKTTRARFDDRAAKARDRWAVDVQESGLPAVTADGIAVTLLANIGSTDEAPHALELGAAGVGLFRTEFLFMERSNAPSEDEQTAAYRRVVEAFAPHPVTLRLLDVGGDKPIPYVGIAPEANPFLGVRALRLAMSDPGLFVTQLRACYRAAVAGPVKVMAPMVADAGDADLLIELARQAREGLAADGLEAGDASLGVMLEIPSAILVADTYFGPISFASIGTNDLLQYTLAVDRGNPALERYRDSLHPALLRLVHEASEAASRLGIELSVCGEMAGDPAAALALVGLGIRSLSMASSSLAAVRRAIRGAHVAELQSAARAALQDPDTRRVRARFKALTDAPAG